MVIGVIFFFIVVMLGVSVAMFVCRRGGVNLKSKWGSGSAAGLENVTYSRSEGNVNLGETSGSIDIQPDSSNA